MARAATQARRIFTTWEGCTCAQMLQRLRTQIQGRNDMAMRQGYWWACAQPLVPGASKHPVPTNCEVFFLRGKAVRKDKSNSDSWDVLVYFGIAYVVVWAPLQIFLSFFFFNKQYFIKVYLSPFSLFIPPCVHSTNARVGLGQSQKSRMQSRSLIWMPRTPLMGPYLLPARVSFSRRQDWI